MQKKNVISRRDQIIEESRVFDNEEICNYDQMAKLEKRKEREQMLNQNDNTPSVIVINNPFSGANHTRNMSNPYGHSFATNVNIISGRDVLNVP